jgi:phosphomevalonate kinase
VKVIAPGKVLLFGAYSVLEGTEALVVAVDRHAVADAEQLEPSASREVRAALGDAPAPKVDLAALYAGGQKLGLGSSAAALVATLGARAAARGEDLLSDGVRRRVFLEAKRAHAAAQGGGSGVDVAASVHGGALFYSMNRDTDPFQGTTTLPAGLALRVLWSGSSARTSELLGQVNGLRARDGRAFGDRIEAIGDCVRLARAACERGDVRALVDVGCANARALAELGRAADAPIVPPAFADLSLLAEREGAAFYPSGAGGGDVGVWLAGDPPSDSFLEHARLHGMLPLDVGMDRAGVRTRKD